MRILRDAGHEELAEKWLVPPEAPSLIETSELHVGSSGEVILRASDFQHVAHDMKHHATRWQVRAAGETFEYSPTLDVTTSEHLEKMVIPAGILLPNRRYVWRVAHVGQNRIQSEFSESGSLKTEDLEYQLKPFDLTRSFNRDVVHTPGDDSEDPFQPVAKQLVIDGYQPSHSTEKETHGVPRNGIIGPHQLGDYQNHNSIQLDSKNNQAEIELTPGTFSSLRLLTGSFHHGYRRYHAALKVTLFYADGTRQVYPVHCPDWELKHTDWELKDTDWELRDATLISTIDRRNPIAERFLTNTVRNGMDRAFTRGGVQDGHFALFDTMIPVDSNRQLASISLLADDNGPLNPGARINVLAITGVENR